MAHGKDVRDRLRRAYVIDRLSLEQAAKLTGVAYSTAARWRDEATASNDDWERARATAAVIAGGNVETLARAAMLEMLAQVEGTFAVIRENTDLSAVQRVELLASLSDSMAKTTAAMRKHLPETNKLAVAMTVIKALAEYIERDFPEVLPDFVRVLEPFGDKLPKILEKI